ncbi:hypothetical protein [Saccharomonospora xinjiangensis]|uniref:ATP synthase I chain n=1 Tax=Saccharomonospora xinjiangensis XJ-54 TaxID=882086 RepID=I0V5J6_9PSEU|nr:hypothetical protein [Saccharomonospora xinjiangensis]EID55399.1 hypothetical protein SacxiDRAFT_3193 [Saccharomonospora xinjiangensis XJ-54]
MNAMDGGADASTAADHLSGAAEAGSSTRDSARDSAQAEVRAAHARSVYQLADAMLRWGLRLSLPPVLVTIGVATVLAGQVGLVGAAFGAVLGFGSSLVTITMMRMAATRPPSALMAVALGGYAAKMSVLLVVMLLLRDVDGFSRPALAFGMLVTVVAWAAADIVAFRTTKTPTLVVPRSAEIDTDA